MFMLHYVVFEWISILASGICYRLTEAAAMVDPTSRTWRL